MSRLRPVLASAAVLGLVAALLAGCGQKGALFIPTEPAAAQRATLPQTLRLGAPAASASAPLPAMPASAVPPP